MSDLGTWLFQKEKETIRALLDMRAPRTGTVLTVVAGSRVTFTDATTGQPWPAEVPVVGQLPAVGERVLVLVVGDGSRVAVRLGPDTLIPHDHDDRYYTDAEVDTLLAAKASASNTDGYIAFAENTGSGATVGSTTNTTTPQTALGVSITLPGAGSTWSVMAFGSIGLICSVSGGRANVRTNINGVGGGNKTSPPLHTSIYTRGMNSDRQSVAGNQTIDVQIQYHCAQASTITAQNPQIVAIARRTA